jgi:hypothetical protein
MIDYLRQVRGVQNAHTELVRTLITEVQQMSSRMDYTEWQAS